MGSSDLPRAYLRVDPNVDQAFPDLRNTFIGLLCSAARQPERGRYQSRKRAEQLHSRAFIRGCLEREDLVALPDGRLYVDGWDEWQEGDLTVAERMRRMRERRRLKRLAVTAGVTPPASRDRNGVTTNAYAVDGSTQESGSSPTGVGVGVGAGGERAPDEGRGEGLLHLDPAVASAWEAAAGRTLLSSGPYAAGLVDDACRRHGPAAVSAAIEASRAGFAFVPSAQALATAVRNRIDPLPAAGRPRGGPAGHTRSPEEVEAGFNR
jgi:hypothetical protein